MAELWPDSRGVRVMTMRCEFDYGMIVYRTINPGDANLYRIKLQGSFATRAAVLAVGI